jgi:hypothetical protein
MKHLFPYRQTKNKAWFEHDGKEATVTRKGKELNDEGDLVEHWEQSGNKMRGVTLLIPLKETVNLDKFKLTYKKDGK